jgi:GAF domain-containing protein
MQTPEKPLNEEARLAALRGYEILDTDPERDYDDLVRIAAAIFGAPVALVSMVDAERQWFKARVGLDATETPREVAFCAHAICVDEPFVVPDAKQDSRFHDNPLVTGKPNIRFYAGAPLVAPGGLNLGTLCVTDTEPRQPTEDQIQSLMALGRQVVNLLEARKAARDLAAALSQVKLLSHLIPVCAHCGNVRDEKDEWQTVEKYICTHTGADFSHGICPVCMKKHYGHIMGSEDLGRS